MKILVIAAFGILCCLPPWTLQAHGPAPSALGVQTYNDLGQPHTVSLSRGLAIPKGHQWQYVCSTVWHGPETPLSGAYNGISMPWIVGSQGLHRLQSNGTSIAIPTVPSITSATARAIAHLETSTLLLMGFTPPSQIWRLQEAKVEVLWESETVWSTMVMHEDQILLAREKDQRLTVGQLSIDTLALNITEIESPMVQSPTLRSAGGRLFIRSYQDGFFHLSELNLTDGTLEERIQSQNPIHGPIAVGNENWFVAVDHQLYRLLPDEIIATGETKPITCLSQNNHGVRIACSYPDLYEVTSEGFLNPSIFLLTALVPPRTDDLSTKDRQACELEWLDLTADAGLDPAGPAPIPLNENTGCSHGVGTPFHSGLALLLFFWFLSRLQKRRLLRRVQITELSP